MAKRQLKIYSVSQINSLVKFALEENLPSRMIISGEISDFKHHSSGHCYFSLKDQNSLLPCVMWASKFKLLKFLPQNGTAALATGHIDIYLPSGKYQFYVDKLEPSGIGALQLAFEQMVTRLKAEGLFEDKYKKPLPAYPQRIGILTSESGAAVGDITNSILNRWPCAKLFLYPVPVQGDDAAQTIAAALRDINKRNKQLNLDILIVGRGGGSLEDLWAFNEEILARAIFDSQIPVISAVGHEYDTTVADFVADARASTPTKAGVIAVPDIEEVLRQLETLEIRLEEKINLLFQNNTQRLNDLELQTISAFKEKINTANSKLHLWYEKIIQIEPHRLLKTKSLQLSDLKNNIHALLKELTNRAYLKLTAAENRLAGMNPKGVLKRGYSITTNKKTGQLVRKPADINIGDWLITELDGENLVESEIKKKQNRKESYKG